MPRGRKTEMQTDGSQRLICVAEEVFCLLCFSVKYKICERDITFCLKTFWEIWSAHIKFFCHSFRIAGSSPELGSLLHILKIKLARATTAAFRQQSTLDRYPPLPLISHEIRHRKMQSTSLFLLSFYAFCSIRTVPNQYVNSAMPVPINAPPSTSDG